MIPALRRSQLNLLGQLDAASITVQLHVYDGVISRDWWISAVDDDDTQILLWSDRTPEGPHGGINLADLLTKLLEISRLVRAASQPLG